MSRTFIVTTILCLCAICGVRAQIVKNGSRWWDGKALYTATVDQEGDIVMNGITQVDGKKKFCLAKADAAGTYYLTKDNPDAEMPVNGKMGNKVVCVKEGANTFLRVLNRNREVNPRYAFCLKFVNCSNCEVENLTIGHTVGGFCSGGVIGAEQSSVTVKDCDLYGCGTYGLNLWW